MTAREIIDTNSNQSPYLRRIMSISYDKKVLVKAGNEHRRVLEEAGFTYVKNATEIRKLTDFRKVAVAPCACGYLLSKVEICTCTSKLIKVYNDRLLNLEAISDIIIRIDGGSIVSTEDLMPKPYLATPINYKIDNACMLLLDKIVDRFYVPRARVLKIACALATMDNSTILDKSYLLEATSYLRAR